jgi:hypothetical protein
MRKLAAIVRALSAAADVAPTLIDRILCSVRTGLAILEFPLAAAVPAQKHPPNSDVSQTRGTGR